MAPRIVMTCRVRPARRSAWASTSATASLSVSATATHPQEQDTTHGAAIVENRIANPAWPSRWLGPRSREWLGARGVRKEATYAPATGPRQTERGVETRAEAHPDKPEATRVALGGEEHGDHLSREPVHASA